MFLNFYRKKVRASLRSKDMLVWMLIFPLFMATIFHFAFGSLDSADQMEPIPTAVVKDEALKNEEVFSTVLDAVSEEGEDQLLILTEVESKEEADRLLDQGKVDGYLQWADGTPRLSVKLNGLNQTILKSFLDSYVQTKSGLTRVLQENPAALQSMDLGVLFSSESHVKEVSLTGSTPSVMVNFFYALLAMTCLYGGMMGLDVVCKIQPNLSPLGARRSLSPQRKLSMILPDFFGTVTIHFGSLLVVFCYMAFVLKVGFGDKWWAVILTLLMGSFAGVSLGALIGAASRLKHTVKTGMLITLTMVCSFLAGLMTSGINYVVAEYCPPVAWVNPAARITDAFYCLYYYDGYGRFFIDMLALGGITAAFLIITAFLVRRQRYESI